MAHPMAAGLLIMLLVMTCTASLAADLNAQPPSLVPGSSNVDTSSIKEYRTTTKWGEQRMIKGEVDGRKTWNIVNAIYSTDNPMIDHIILDQVTLEYMGRFAPFFAIGKHYLSSTITDQKLSGSLNPIDGGDPIIINIPLDSKVFQEASLGIVLASLPLELDYRATLPRLAISASSKAFSAGSLAIHVTGREEIQGGDGNTYSCWIVEAQWAGVDYHEIHWIADVPPYSIQKKATFPSGRKSESNFLTVTSEP